MAEEQTAAESDIEIEVETDQTGKLVVKGKIPTRSLAGQVVRFVIGKDTPRTKGFLITDTTNVILLTPTGNEIRSAIALSPNED